MKENIEAVVYSDASIRKGSCGIGICLLNGHGKLIKKVSRRVVGYGGNITALEGRAICEGISLAHKHGFKSIRVYTDAKVLVDAAAKGKGRAGVVKKFVETLKEIRAHIHISLRWVKGHVGQRWNTTCDHLAGSARWTFSQVISLCIEVVRFGLPSEYRMLTRRLTS